MSRSATENARLTDTGHTEPVLRSRGVMAPPGHHSEMTVTAVNLYDPLPDGLLTGIVGHVVGIDGDGNEITVPLMELVPAVGARVLLLFNDLGDPVIYATLPTFEP